MKRRRKSSMGKKLQAIADGTIVDSNCINVWLDDNGAPRQEPGRKTPIAYHRADGGPRLKAPYVELFARERRPGWDAWGNEVGKFGTMEAAE